MPRLKRFEVLVPPQMLAEAYRVNMISRLFPKRKVLSVLPKTLMPVADAQGFEAVLRTGDLKNVRRVIDVDPRAKSARCYVRLSRSEVGELAEFARRVQNHGSVHKDRLSESQRIQLYLSAQTLTSRLSNAVGKP